MDMPGSVKPRKGRGAVSNDTGRFETERRVAFDDGWEVPGSEPDSDWDEGAGRVATTLSVDATRTIIARNDSPDIGFDRSINPYRGCEHGCIYCYARPSHAYLGLSPGLDFETRIFYKPHAAALLTAELRKKGYNCRPIALGSNTDPYQPAERRLGITRAILEVLRDFRHPVTIVTKGALIQRDLDILGDMAKDNLAVVTVSVTTLERDLARRMEPRAATPERRLDTIAALAAAGVPTGVLAAPMIPALNDREMEEILERARAAGATVHAVAPAARIEGAVQGMAHGARAAKGRARPLPGRAMPWRADLRFGLVKADDRQRALRRDARRALRPRVPPPRLFPAHAPGARLRPIPPAAAEGRPARALLISWRRGDRIESRSMAEGGVARERRLEARDVEAIFREFAKVMSELPPDTEAGWLDAEGDLRLAPDIGRKLRTARNVRDVLRQIREAQEDLN
jgi:DNA repair photolyase